MVLQSRTQLKQLSTAHKVKRRREGREGRRKGEHDGFSLCPAFFGSAGPGLPQGSRTRSRRPAPAAPLSLFTPPHSWQCPAPRWPEAQRGRAQGRAGAFPLAPPRATGGGKSELEPGSRSQRGGGRRQSAGMCRAVLCSFKGEKTHSTQKRDFPRYVRALGSSWHRAHNGDDHGPDCRL